MSEIVAKEIKEGTQESQSPAEGVQLVPVRNSLSSGTRLVARGENGRFARSKKRLEKELRTVEKVEDDLKALVTRPATDAEGKPILDKGGKPVPLHVAVAEKLLNMMLNLSEEKAIGAAGKTLESILTRALGKPSDSPVTRDALTNRGITVVLVPTPEGLPVVKEEATQKAPLVPSWIRTNPATNKDVPEQDEQ